MTSARDLLDVDFDGRPTADPESVVDAGLADPRHRDRVPQLVALMLDLDAPAADRFRACNALATWGEAAGYREIVAAAAEPERASWYGESIDRKFSVGNTFATLAIAVRASEDIAVAKGSVLERVRALAALVRIADRVYFDEQLEWSVAAGPVVTVAIDVEQAVRSGAERLDTDDRPAFDLATQLVDLTVPLVLHDEALAVELATAVMAAGPSPRVLQHAVEIVGQGDGPTSAQFGEYLAALGGDRLHRLVEEAVARRDSASQPSVYLATLTPGRTRANPAGVVRRRTVDGHPVDEAFTRRLRWERTTELLEHRFGRSDHEYVQITPAEAAAFVRGIVLPLP